MLLFKDAVPDRRLVQYNDGRCWDLFYGVWTCCNFYCCTGTNENNEEMSTNSYYSFPYRLLVYKGDILNINGASTIRQLASILSRWDTVIINESYHDTTSSNYSQVKALIKQVKSFNPNSKFLGSIDVSSYVSTPDTAKGIIQDFAMLGCSGIVFENCGYNNSVTRALMNELVEYAHLYYLYVIAQCDNPDDIFSGANRQIGYYQGDGFIIYNFVFDNGLISAESTQKTLLDKLISYRENFADNNQYLSIYGSGTIDYSMYDSLELQDRLRSLEAFAAIFSLNGYGLQDLNNFVTGGDVEFFNFMPDYPYFYTNYVEYEYSSSSKTYSRTQFNKTITVAYDEPNVPVHHVDEYKFNIRPVPATATSAGALNDVAIDQMFYYICIKSGTEGNAQWLRVPIMHW